MNRTRVATIAILVVAVMALMGPAFAGSGSSEEPPRGVPPAGNPPQNDPRTVADPPRAPEVQARSATLPVTGGDLVPFAAVGSLTVLSGAALVRGARRQTARG